MAAAVKGETSLSARMAAAGDLLVMATSGEWLGQDLLRENGCPACKSVQHSKILF